MCGIFGYIGKGNAAESVINGLKRLEYRGYDSWGIGVIEKNKIKIHKKTGSIGNVKEIKYLANSSIAIGHTRWATHGGVTKINAHPHFSSDKSFVLAQNGIVENYQELKRRLIKKGYKFVSETDTEVIVRLIEEYQKKHSNFHTAVRKAFLDLEGRNTIIVLSKAKGEVVAIRNGSPLVIGLGKDEVFFASDTLSFADKTNKAVIISDLEMARYFDSKLELFDVKSGKKKNVKRSTLEHGDIEINKEGYEHFMLKEIVEQKDTIKYATDYKLKELEPLIREIKKARDVFVVGAGTAGFAAGQIAYYLRKYASIDATELKSYEIDSYREIFENKDLIIAVSQSGETADTIEALEYAKEKGLKIASIVNMLGSTTTRMSDYPFFTRSGPEICVASTKAFTAQIAWGYLLSMAIAGKYRQAKIKLSKLVKLLDSYFNKDLFKKIKDLANRINEKEHFFVLGKGGNFNVALEGALKIKEISYKHFEGFAAGELKHGVIALIDKGTPVFVITSDDESYEDIISASSEVKARGAFVIGIGSKSNELFDVFIKTPDIKQVDSITNVVPFQLISYFLATSLGHPPDKPRNLAKSVTVK